MSNERQAAGSEIDRICGLPFAHAPTEGLAEWLTRPGASRQLRPVQLAMLAEIAQVGGGLGPLGVGHGKTLCALLAGTVLGKERTIILTRAGAKDQLADDEIDARRDFHVGAIEIASYESISHQKLGQAPALDVAARGCPDDRLLIVADEAHALKDPSSNRTRRLIRFLTEHPQVAFVALSGTFTSRKIGDYSHLADLAIGARSPVTRPRFHTDHAHLSQCIDADGQPSRGDWLGVEKLWRTYYPTEDVFACSISERRTKLRLALAHRLAWSPGVHVAPGTSCDASIDITTIRVKSPEMIAQALTYVRNTGDDLDGIPLLDDLQRDKALRTIVCGYFYRCVWPRGTSDGAKATWIRARKHYSSELRDEIENFARANYDSRGLIEETMRRALAERGAQSRLEHAFIAWKEQEALIVPGRECVWLDPYMVNAVLAFAHGRREPWLIWYEGIPFGDALASSGMSVYGADSRPELDPATKSIAVSLNAHTESVNLQRFSRNFIVSPPSSGKIWEQLLGRTHRQNQTADVVEVRVLNGTLEFDKSLTTARRDALYRQESTGVPERLCFASWRTS